MKIKSKNEFEKISINNRTCHYFDNIMVVDEDININRILLDEKSYENILVYNILYKHLWMENHFESGTIN